MLTAGGFSGERSQVSVFHQLMLDLSVVIPTHQRPKALNRLLASLKAQFCHGLGWEVIVVHNKQEDHPDRHYWQRHLPVRWLCTGLLGVNRARNMGLLHAKGKVVLFLDDDTEARDLHLLARHCQFHEMNPEASAIGGIYELPQNASYFSSAYHTIAMAWILRYVEPTGACPYLLGGHASYKRAALSDEFRFNESIDFGAAETELNWRLALAGKKLFLHPDLKVTHHVATGPRALMRKAFLQTRNARFRKEIFGSPAPHISEEEAMGLALQLEPRGRHPVAMLGRWIYVQSARIGWNTESRSALIKLFPIIIGVGKKGA